MGGFTRAWQGKCALEALLVEDDDLDAQVLTAFADMNGECEVRVTRARTLREAGQLARDGHYDLYFVDLHLGEASSLGLLARLECSGARPVVLSNVSPQEAEQYRLNEGALRFLSKGECSPARIGAFVREALEARRAAAPEI